MLAEALVALLVHAPESRLRIEVACGVEVALCPERELAVAGATREAHTFIDELPADPQPAGMGLYQQQSQLRHGLRLAHEKYRTDDLAVTLRDPAALARRVEPLHEPGRDLGDQRLEAFVVAVFLRVQCAVAMNHPADVARLMRPQKVRRRVPAPALRRLAERCRNRAHGLDHAQLRGGSQPAEHGAVLGARARV